MTEIEKNDRDENIQKTELPPPLKRMDAHQYEKTIKELLEKIEILEDRLKLLGDQKVKLVDKLTTYEEDNKRLKDKLSNQKDNSKQFTFDREQYEKQIADLQLSKQKLDEKSKDRIELLNKELEKQQNEMDQINQQLKEKNDILKANNVKNEMSQKYENENEKELTFQKNTNKQLNDKILDLQKEIDSLHVQKRTEGSLLLQIEQLKDDNHRLLKMLKSTEEFKDFAYLSETVDGGVRFIKQQTQRKPSHTATQNSGKKTINGKTPVVIPNSQKEIRNNENWVPNDAYSFAIHFKNKYNLDLSENVINDLLISLNKIWQNREKQQINALKTQYQAEIFSLRRKLAMSTGYQDYTYTTTISNLRKELKQTRDDLRDNIVLKNKLRSFPNGVELVDNALKAAATFQNTKKCLENEIESLKKQIAQKHEKYSGTHQFYNQGVYWMASKSFDEIDFFGKNIEQLFSVYEEKVKTSNVFAGQNDLVDYHIRLVNNAVKSFFSTVKDLTKGVREKFSNWKDDTQRNLDYLKNNFKAK